MTQLSTTFLILAGLMAILDWFAVARESAVLEYVSKPLATGALLATAVALDVSHDGPWAWRVAALAFCILGDVCLMLPRDAFIPGLASFAVGQVLFTVSFLSGDTSTSRFAVAVLVAVPVAALLARRFVGAIRRAGRGELVVPVIVYMAVISVMAVSAVASGSALAIAGALLFMLSDSLIAESRFVKMRAWQPVAIMVTYHAALAGLTLALV